MKTRVLVLISAMATSFLVGCESKVSEKKVEGYNAGNLTVEKIALSQSSFDDNVQKIQLYLEKIKNILSAAQKSLNTSEGFEPLSILDVVYEMNSALKQENPIFDNEGLLINGFFKVQTKLLTSACQKFKYQITADKMSPLRQLDYAMQSCAYDNSYLKILKANFEKSKVTLIFDNYNVEKLFPSTILSRPDIPECSFPSNSASPIVCKNLSVGQTDKTAWFADVISGKTGTAIEYAGIDKKTGELLYHGKVVISPKGEITYTYFSGPKT